MPTVSCRSPSGRSARRGRPLRPADRAAGSSGPPGRARFYDAMKAEIEAAGGTVEKFAGDAVMAAFGAPEALEDHAERALHAALSMQRKVERGLELRIGVNTGEVVVGPAREASSFV